MIKSMTGYGSARGTAGGIDLTIELKSVNNRYLDTVVHSPRSFLFAEDPIKSAVQKRICRGRIDIFVTVNSYGSDDVQVKLNDSLLNSYISTLEIMSSQFSLPNDISVMSAARLPDVLSLEKTDLDSDLVLSGILDILDLALNDFDAMREREGEKLYEDILFRLAAIDGFVGDIERASPETVEAYRARLEAKMREVLENTVYDDSRVLAEVAVFSDKISVDEETVRLKSHISQLSSMLENGSPIGKKLDFLIQEFNREANTIGSKSQNSEIAYIVVELKSEIEKIREQVQNIE